MSALLVTGARGFIGSAVLRALATAGSTRVILAGRRSDALALAPGHRAITLDLLDPQLALPEGVHTVLHLAGEKRDTTRMAGVNHIGALRLVEAAARAGVRRFVHLSSVGVYGAPWCAGLVDEHHAHTPRNAYEASKHLGELAVRERCAALGLSCMVLQPSNVLGFVPGHGWPLLGLARTVARGWFRHVRKVDEAWVDYVALDDVAAALLAAVQHEQAQGVYIVNTPVPLRAFVGWMASELGVPAPTRAIPAWLAWAAAGAGAAGSALLRRELPVSPSRVRELTNTTRYDGSALTRGLGFAYPVGIEQAVRTLMQQYRRDGLVPGVTAA